MNFNSVPYIKRSFEAVIKDLKLKGGTSIVNLYGSKTLPSVILIGGRKDVDSTDVDPVTKT